MFSWLMSKWYDKVLAGAEEKCLGEWRQALLAGISGEVLEIGCGCHLTRDTEKSIESSGFNYESIVRGSMRGVPPFVRPSIHGVAVKK